MKRLKMKTQPPPWAPNAIATERGWVDPNTGELLVSMKGIQYENETKKKRGRPKGSKDSEKRDNSNYFKKKKKSSSKKKKAKKVKK